MSITFHIAHHHADEITALTTEGAPTLNVHNARAAHMLAILDVGFDWPGEIDPRHVLARLDAGPTPGDAIDAARLGALRAVATAAARIGRDIAWD